MFDFPAWLKDQFGTPDSLVALPSMYGLPSPRRETVYKWFSRGRVPVEWFALLLSLLEIEQGAPSSIARYFVRRES